MTAIALPLCYGSALLARPPARAEGRAVPVAPSTALPDWVGQVAAVLAFLITGGAALFAWLWSERNKLARTEKEEKEKNHSKELKAKDDALTAAAAAAAAELQRVRAEAIEKANAKADLDAAFQKVGDKLGAISDSIHAFREDFNGQIHDIKLSALAMEKKVLQLEQDLGSTKEDVTDLRGKLNALIVSLQSANVIISQDPSSSTSIRAVTPTRRG